MVSVRGKFTNLRSTDLIFYGLLLMASKWSTRFGDGLAQLALLRYWLTDFYETGRVSCNASCYRPPLVTYTSKLLGSVLLQVKYAICSIRNTIAVSRAMGDRVAADIKHNSFVNTKGDILSFL